MKKLSLILTVSALSLASSAWAGEACKGTTAATKSSAACSAQSASACCSSSKATAAAKRTKASQNIKGAQLMAMR